MSLDSQAPVPRPDSGTATRRDRGIPPRLIPILYFATAHLSLFAAFALISFDAGEFAGFFYHPRMIAAVHLVTLGWITTSILGALYIIGPMALRTPMPARGADYAAWGFVTVGIAGFVSHLWINSYGGAGWAGILVLLGVLHVGAKALKGILRAPIQPGVKAHFAFAFLNISGAGLFGILLAFDKKRPFLPARELGNVFAHAHLAALGWATMMVIGAGYRMLPMILPSAMPAGRSLSAGAGLLEAGILGLFVALLFGSRWSAPCALLVVAGLAIFLAHVGWMRRNLRPAPLGHLRPDYGVLHSMAALGYLGAGALAGLVLASGTDGEWTWSLAPVYGVAGLLGFLGQMVVGVEARVLPMFASYHANRSACQIGPVVKPQEMPVRWLQPVVFLLWQIGVPVLALALVFENPRGIAAGGATLLTAALLGGLNLTAVLSHAYRRPRIPSADERTPPGSVTT